MIRALTAPFTVFGRHRGVAMELTRREILGRYRGANFGLFWSLLSPFLMLIVYTLAFGEIMGARWPQMAGGDVQFGMILFVAIIVHGFFAECFIRGPKLILDHPNFVKRVVFPLQILPWPMAFSALFHALMNVAVFGLLSLALHGSVPATIVLLPLIFIPLLLMTLSAVWVVAALGVYVRDISQVVPVLATAMFFLSSAIIPLEAVPERYRLLFHLNPLTFFIDQARAVALWGEPPDWGALGLATAATLVGAVAAVKWFQHCSKGFSDVL